MRKNSKQKVTNSILENGSKFFLELIPSIALKTECDILNVTSLEAIPPLIPPSFDFCRGIRKLLTTSGNIRNKRTVSSFCNKTLWNLDHRNKGPLGTCFVISLVKWNNIQRMRRCVLGIQPELDACCQTFLLEKEPNGTDSTCWGKDWYS